MSPSGGTGSQRRGALLVVALALALALHGCEATPPLCRHERPVGEVPSSRRAMADALRRFEAWVRRHAPEGARGLERRCQRAASKGGDDAGPAGRCLARYHDDDAVLAALTGLAPVRRLPDAVGADDLRRWLEPALRAADARAALHLRNGVLIAITTARLQAVIARELERLHARAVFDARTIVIDAATDAGAARLARVYNLRPITRSLSDPLLAEGACRAARAALTAHLVALRGRAQADDRGRAILGRLTALERARRQELRARPRSIPVRAPWGAPVDASAIGLPTAGE